MRFFLMLCLVALLEGCIKNDIPMPVIYGNVQKIEFNGQEKCVINTKTRSIELTLSDTVDIQNVRLVALELSADPAREQEVVVKATASLMVDSLFDLSEPYKFVVNTYQEYEWTIVANQPIERYFNVENQIGEAVINVEEKMVRVVVGKDQDLTNIKVEDVKLGSSLANYDPEPTDLTNFQKQQAIYVTTFGRTERWLVSVFKDTGEESGDITGGVNAWAKFAYLTGNIPSGSTGQPYFEYRQARKTNWTKLEADVVGKTFSAKVTGLKPKTDYVFRAVVGDQIGSEVAFTTEVAEQVAYSNFDKWFMDGKAWYTGEAGIETWDTGNKGGASFGFNPTTEESEETIKGSAARLQSCWAAVKFAAGSLYTGKFAGLDGFNAMLDFGIPYQGRPTTLTGYYKYIPGVVNRLPKNDDRFNHLKGEMDSCHIYVALCDWTEAFHANTKTETLLDCSENNKSIIAYGELKTSQAMTQYEKFSIDIKYRDLTKKPTYIVIVATSSKYGDYFAGSDTSLLLLDEFELGFD